MRQPRQATHDSVPFAFLAPEASWESGPGHSETLTLLTSRDIMNGPCLLVCLLSHLNRAPSLALWSLSSNTPLRAGPSILSTSEALLGDFSLHLNLVSLPLPVTSQRKVAFKFLVSQRTH